MDKAYDHKKVEEKLYKKWEEAGYFKPEIHPDGKPYCIILPPPNANGALHFGHAMFTVEDILIRYHRMKGYSTLWLPGTDHAGIETQFVFEKKLQEEGKSRLDFDRETLYKMIHEYVEENRGGIEKQLRRLGFSLDWSRSKYTLDPDVVTLVYETFQKMYNDGLVYRDYRLVNYCTKDGTSFSDLEIVHEERKDPLYYIKYGSLVLATTRPETKFGDTAVAVHPKDKRYKKYIGKELEIETVLGKATIMVVADESVDPEFGTGVVKITPAHDFNDYEVAKRHNLPMKQVIGFDGKMNDFAGKFKGLYVKQARKVVVEEMQQKGLIEKIDEEYTHRISLCYKCKTVLEPLPLEQWYVKVAPLVQQSVKALDKGEIKVFPKNFEHVLLQWYEGLRDWNISRQNVWGIRIPVWYEVEDESQFSVVFLDKNKNLEQGILHEVLAKGFSFEEITRGLQRVSAMIGVKVVFEEKKEKGKRYLPETDTFDTWFSSGQWPYVTLQTTKPGDFEKFYPTSVMETAYDILRAWVSRMIMLGMYKTGDVPFRHVLFHGIVNDPYGKKMSKSKGNVVNPLELIDQYGADAVRFALIYGNATGNDQSLSYPKLDAARKFANKLWNMGRFIEMKKPAAYSSSPSVSLRVNESRSPSTGSGLNSSRPRQTRLRTIKTLKELEKTAVHENDKAMIEKTKQLITDVEKAIEIFRLHDAAQKLYDFAWHEFADKYIEDVKNRIDHNSFTVLSSLFLVQLKLLHPFMPFITEEIYQKISGHGESIMIEKWPEVLV